MRIVAVFVLTLLGVSYGYDDYIRQAVDVAREHADDIQSHLTQAGYAHIGQRVAESLQEDTTCLICRTVVDAAKEIFVDISYPDVRDTVIQLCKEVISSPTTRADIFCPALMDLQAPHVISVVKNSKTNKFNFCRNVNMCFAPKTGQRQEPLDPEFGGYGAYPMRGRKPDFLRGGKTLDTQVDPGFNAPPEFLHTERKQGETGPVYGKAPLTSEQGEEIDQGFNAPSDFLVQANEKVNPAEIEVEPMEAAAKDLKILHLADIHVDPKYAVGSPTDCGLTVCCHSDLEGTGKARPYGEFTCNIPQRTVEAILKEAKAMNPDFILYTGDNPPHHIWDETRESQLNCSRLVYESMRRMLPGIKIFSAMGNHENYPTNIYSPRQKDSQMLTSELARLWSPLAGFDKAQEETVKKAAYYTTLVRPGLRILTVNTNLWYVFNWYNTINELESEFSEMKAFFINTLQSAKTNKEKVIVVYHHPPGTADQLHTASRWLSDVIIQYRDIIILQVAGHTHRDSFKIFSEGGIPKAMVYVEPSVTSRDSKGGIYPSMRMFHLDASTLKVKDYDQYRYDILASKPAVKLAYSAKKEYNLNELTPESWFELSNRMMIDFELREKWLLNNHAGVRVNCDEECVNGRICDLRHTVIDDVIKCEENAQMEFEQPMADPALFNAATRLSLSILPTVLFSVMVALTKFL